MLARNLLSVTLSALLSFAVSYLLASSFTLNNPFWPWSILYYSIFCFAINLVYAAKAGTEDFTGLLLVGIVVKLLLAFILVFLCSFFAHSLLFSFSMHFIAHYILFTIFEIRYLFQLIKLKRRHEKNHTL